MTVHRSTVYRRAMLGSCAVLEAAEHVRSLEADSSPANVARYLWSAAGMYERLPTEAQDAVRAEIDRRVAEIDAERADASGVLERRYRDRVRKRQLREKLRAKNR